ncbi:MAG: hypothetical protein V1872_08105 [bacterium]
MPKKQTPSTDNKRNQISDILWKGIIEDLFQDFVIFFMPALYTDVDFTRAMSS